MYEYELYKPKVIKGTGVRIYKDNQVISDMGVFKNKRTAIVQAGALYMTYAGIKQKYTGKKSEYFKRKEGNFQKVHPLDLI